MENLERYRLTSADVTLHRCTECGHGENGALGGWDNNYSYTLPYPHRHDCSTRKTLSEGTQESI
jgi:hypothetical protein